MLLGEAAVLLHTVAHESTMITRLGTLSCPGCAVSESQAPRGMLRLALHMYQNSAPKCMCNIADRVCALYVFKKAGKFQET